MTNKELFLKYLDGCKAFNELVRRKSLFYKHYSVNMPVVNRLVDDSYDITDLENEYIVLDNSSMTFLGTKEFKVNITNGNLYINNTGFNLNEVRSAIKELTNGSNLSYNIGNNVVMSPTIHGVMFVGLMGMNEIMYWTEVSKLDLYLGS